MAKDLVGKVLPQITVDSVDHLRSFYLEKLGFEHMMGVIGKDGEFDFCIVTLNGAEIMLNRPLERIEGSQPKYPTRRPLDLYVQVTDVDQVYEQIIGRSVKIANELQTQWWGDRNFSVQDPYGYHIWFFQSVGPPNPPAGVKLV